MSILSFKKGGLAVILSLFIGVAFFIYFLFKLGPNALDIIKNVKISYVALFFLCTIILFFLMTLRHKIIIEAYKKKIKFFTLLRQCIAGYAVSYITPAARFGGEPIRVLMLKREAGIDYRTASASVLMDKFIEITGLVLFGFLGVVFFIFAPKISYPFKIFVAFSLIFIFLFLIFFYMRCIKNKGALSIIFNLFLLDRIPKLDRFIEFIKDVEKKMGYFFRHHKKQFVKAMIIYVIYLLLTIIQLKFLLLALGVNVSIVVIVVSLTFLGVAEVIPVPAALGFLEAGQSAVFSLFSKGGSLGFAVSIVLRISALIFISLGFVFLSHFGWKEIEKLLKNIFKNPKKC